MKVGIAFIRGLNFYSCNRINREEVLRILKTAESKDLKILGTYKADNIIFEKRHMHFATAGKIFEGALEKRFNKKIYVTTRSLASVEGIVRRAEELRR
jgi:uncharacterized protein (DUF1697 family)